MHGPGIAALAAAPGVSLAMGNRIELQRREKLAGGRSSPSAHSRFRRKSPLAYRGRVRHAPLSGHIRQRLLKNSPQAQMAAITTWRTMHNATAHRLIALTAMGKSLDDEFTALRLSEPRNTNPGKFRQLIGIGCLLCHQIAKDERPLGGHTYSNRFERFMLSQASGSAGGHDCP